MYLFFSCTRLCLQLENHFSSDWTNNLLNVVKNKYHFTSYDPPLCLYKYLQYSIIEYILVRNVLRNLWFQRSVLPLLIQMNSHVDELDFVISSNTFYGYEVTNLSGLVIRQDSGLPDVSGSDLARLSAQVLGNSISYY